MDAPIGQRLMLLASNLTRSTRSCLSPSSASFPSRMSSKEIKCIANDLEEKTAICKGVNAVIAEAEMQLMHDNSVREWLLDLRRWADNVEHFMDEYDYECLALQESELASSSSGIYSVSPLLSSPSFLQGFTNGLESLGNQISHIGRQRDTLILTSAIGSRPLDDSFTDHPASGSLPNSCEFFGRGQEFQQLRYLLLDGDENNTRNVEVLAVIGMGGIGKTNLVQQVYNDPFIKTSFKRGWIFVSERFDVPHLLNAAVECLTGVHCTLTEVSVLQDRLKCVLPNERKVLVVLDNVWNEDMEKWDTFIAPFEHGAIRGSKILITTRLEGVADISRAGGKNSIRLSSLSDSEGWSLLREHTFGRGGQNVLISEETEHMGKEIVRKCQGLPLAIMVLAGLLNSMGSDKEDSWRNVMESRLLDLKDSGAKRILGSLYLSYLHLEPQLKRCFRFCSIYSKLRLPGESMENLNIRIVEQNGGSVVQGFYINVENLKLFWMLFDIVKDDRDAEICLQKLKSRCFLDELKDYFRLGRYVSMHDVLHDLAEFVFMDKHIIMDGSLDNTDQVEGSCSWDSWHGSVIVKTCDIAETDLRQRNLSSARLALCSNILSARSFEFGPILEALYMNGIAIGESDFMLLCSRSFRGLKGLRILSVDFSGTSVSCVPQEIFHLYNLRYLKLTHSSVTFLSDSLGKLRNLRCLNLAHNCLMGNLPESISKLVNLIELDVVGTSMEAFPRGITSLTNLLRLNFDSDSISHMPAGFGELQKLQYLPEFVAGSNACQASVAELKHLVNLKDTIHLLNLRHVENPEDAEEARMKDKKLLRILHLCWGNYFPFNRERPRLGRREEGEAVNREEKVISCLNPHLNLEVLVVREYLGSKLPSWMGDDCFTKLITICFSHMKNCTSLFPVDQLPSLVNLQILVMPELLHIVSDENDRVSQANREQRRPFPKLEYLFVSCCAKLKFLHLRDFPSIRRVDVKACPNLKGMDPPSNDVSSLESVSIGGCPRFRYKQNPARPHSWKLQVTS